MDFERILMIWWGFGRVRRFEGFCRARPLRGEITDDLKLGSPIGVAIVSLSTAKTVPTKNHLWQIYYVNFDRILCRKDEVQYRPNEN